MATVDSPELVRGMLRNNGIYRDDSGEDPAPFAIAQYLNDYGVHAWSLCYSESAFRSLISSPHCTGIVVFWSQADGLTTAGRDFLDAPNSRSARDEPKV